MYRVNLNERELNNYFDRILSKYHFGFRKGHSAQYCLILLIEKLKRHLNENNMFGMILTDLSKAFDCIPHDLLIAKLEAYGLAMSSLRIIYSYLTKRKQRVRINNSYSDSVRDFIWCTSGIYFRPSFI